MTIRSRFTSRFSMGLALALAVVPVTRIAHAQEPTTNAESLQVRYRKAYDAFRAKQWTEARRLLLEMWNESKSYDVAIVLAQVENKLNNHAAMIPCLEFAIANAPPTEKPATVEQLKVDLDQAKSVVGTVRITANRDGAEVVADGAPVGVTPLQGPIYLNVGTHEIEARLAGETSKQTIDVLAGSTHELTFALSATTETPVAHPPREQPATNSPPRPSTSPEFDTKTGPSSSTRTVVLLTGAGITLAAAAVGTVFAVKASSADSEAESYRSDVVERFGIEGCGGTTDDVTSLCNKLDASLDDRNSYRKTTTVSFAVAGVAGAATLAAFFLWPANEAPAAGTLRISPMAERGRHGLVLGGVF